MQALSRSSWPVARRRADNGRLRLSPNARRQAASGRRAALQPTVQPGPDRRSASGEYSACSGKTWISTAASSRCAARSSATPRANGVSTRRRPNVAPAASPARTVTRALVEHRAGKRRTPGGRPITRTTTSSSQRSPQALEVRNLVNRHFKPILKTAKLPLRSACTICGTRAPRCSSPGRAPKIVSERLGHASVTLTLDTYSHVLPTMQQQAADKLEAVLFGGRG